MPQISKFTRTDVNNILRHNERSISTEKDYIDSSKSDQNYCLSPERGMTFYDYYKNRLDEIYVFNRSDVITMASWVVTLPKDTPKGQEEIFFKLVYNFLEERYGKENVVQAIVHKDETTPHLHFCFVPVVEDAKHEQGFKVCYDQRIPRAEYRNFHPALEKYLHDHGMNVKIKTGITYRQGGNLTVAQLKERSMGVEHNKQRERTWHV